QRQVPGVRRVMPRACSCCEASHLAERFVGLDVRFTDAEVDRGGRGQGVDLPNQGEFDSIETFRGPRSAVRGPRHRNASSNAVAESVFSSRYFTIVGVETCRPCCSANWPFMGREAGTTTAPNGISRARSGVRR